MNGLGKPFRKKSDPKNRKNSKNQSEIATCEEKTTTEKPNFCSNTVFSLFFKIRAKKFHAAKPLAFSLHFLFRRDQNHYFNLTSKIIKLCEQILKKRQRPNTIQILWIVKNHYRILLIVITIRAVKSIKLALASEALNKVFLESDFSMLFQVQNIVNSTKLAECNWSINISQRILWPQRHAGRVLKSYEFMLGKLKEHTQFHWWYRRDI